MRIVITGGCGFLGQHLARRLLAEAATADVVLLDLRDNRRPRETETDARLSVRLGRDVCEPASLEADLEGADLLIHLAGVISFSARHRDRLYQVNVEGTRRVIETAIRRCVPRLIHVSSVAALGYGAGAHDVIDEESTFDWREAHRFGKHYMLSKHLADGIVRELASDIDTVIVYPGLMLGPGDRTTAAKFVGPIQRGSARLLAPGGTNIVDVRDVARGIATIAAARPRRDDYVLSGANVSFRELAGEIAAALGARAPDLMVPAFSERPLYHLVRLAEAVARRDLDLTADGVHSAFRHRYYSNARARADLGWSPAIPLATTIGDTVAWLLDENARSVGTGNRRQ